MSEYIRITDTVTGEVEVAELVAVPAEALRSVEAFDEWMRTVFTAEVERG
jgi:hypothetical protein